MTPSSSQKCHKNNENSEFPHILLNKTKLAKEAYVALETLAHLSNLCILYTSFSFYFGLVKVNGQMCAQCFLKQNVCEINKNIKFLLKPYICLIWRQSWGFSHMIIDFCGYHLLLI